MFPDKGSLHPLSISCSCRIDLLRLTKAIAKRLTMRYSGSNKIRDNRILYPIEIQKYRIDYGVILRLCNT